MWLHKVLVENSHSCAKYCLIIVVFRCIEYIINVYHNIALWAYTVPYDTKLYYVVLYRHMYFCKSFIV